MIREKSFFYDLIISGYVFFCFGCQGAIQLRRRQLNNQMTIHYVDQRHVWSLVATVGFINGLYYGLTWPLDKTARYLHGKDFKP